MTAVIGATVATVTTATMTGIVTATETVIAMATMTTTIGTATAIIGILTIRPCESRGDLPSNKLAAGNEKGRQRVLERLKSGP